MQKLTIPLPDLDRKIFIIRNQRVMLDNDLASVYGVPTFRFNEAVRRNIERFPEDFAFQLSKEEWESLRSQFAILKKGRGEHRKYLPFVFTEHGALQASNILHTSQAIQAGIYIVRAFIRMREELAGNLVMKKRLTEIEKTLLSHDSALRDLYAKIKPLLLPPPLIQKPPIGFKVKPRN